MISREQVRRDRDFFDQAEPYSLNQEGAETLRQAYVSLCDSWLAQAKVIGAQIDARLAEARRRHEP